MDVRVLAGIGAIVALIVIMVVPRRLAPRHLFDDHASRLGVENEIRRTIIQMLGGSFVLASVFFTYQTVRISQESLKLTERGQITERFTRAIDQIGSDRLDVAIGGIYALGQLARESKTEHVPIMDILETYIHEHSLEMDFDKCEREGLRIDIQAAITVIGSRNLAFEDDETVIDLEGIHLATADFSGGNYEHVSFSGSCLSGADFHDAQLREVDFSRRSITSSAGAHLSTPTILAGAIFDGAQAAGADFSNAFAWPVSMVDADLVGANFNLVSFGGSGPSTRLGSNLSGADLRDADLRAADLTLVTLEGTDLRGANMKRASVDRSQLEKALTDESTVFP